MVKQATEDEASFGTKKNALETMRKIGKSICLGPADSLMREVRNAFGGFGPTPYVEGIKAIIHSMADDDRGEWIDSGGANEWLDQVEELLELGEGLMLFEGLEKVSDWLHLVEEDEDSEADSEW